jgi:hypothetical protein
MFRSRAFEAGGLELISLDDKWKRMEEAVWKEASNTIGYTHKNKQRKE